MVIVSCPAAGTQPTAGNWSGPRAQRNKRPVWIWALHGYFMFATVFLLRDRVVTGGEASNHACMGNNTRNTLSTKMVSVH